MITRKQIEAFLLTKQGYLKKSSLETAKRLWLTSNIKPKTKSELQRDLDLISDVKSKLSKAKSIQNTQQEETLLQTYQEIIDQVNRPKRKLFFDLEVSANIVFSWRIGNDISLPHDSIIKERAIICVCYKWNDEKEVHSIEWKNGCDKDLLKKFAKIIDSADEVIGQNSDRFDIKWLRARCIHHDIPVSPKFNSIDTLKMAKAGFYFNSNKLDYMGQFLGLGKKIKTESDLWKNITLFNDRKAMKSMVTYCKQDVNLLEQVYNKLQKFCPVKKFRYKV